MIRGIAISEGTAVATVCRLNEPVSFWGGVSEAGVVIDQHHPQFGLEISGKILVMPSGRGSSSSSSVLAELIRTGAAPAAIILSQPDAIIVLGAIIAAELYNIAVPIVIVSPAELNLIPNNTAISVTAAVGAGEIDWS